jgi:outer membrane lipoprotein SlyB
MVEGGIADGHETHRGTDQAKDFDVKQGFIAVLLAASAFALAGGTTFAPEDYGYSEAGSIQNVFYGTIESVRRVNFDEDHPAVGIGPREQTGEELVVRLDSGETIAVVQGGSQGFEPGQRVRVLTRVRRARVEPV